MSNDFNWKLIAKDNSYPRHGGVAALIGIYPTEEGAEFIKDVVRKKFTYSVFEIIKTNYPLTVKYPENFSKEKLKKGNQL